MILPVLASALAADLPDRLGTVVAVSGDPTDLALADDGMWVATVGGGTAFVLSTATFEATAVSTCAGAEAVTATPIEDGTAFWIGCEDGTVQLVYAWNRGAVDEAVTGSEVAGGAIRGLETDGEILYVVYDDGDSLAVTAWDTVADATASGSWPVSLSGSPDTLADTAFAEGILYVVHASDDVSKVFSDGSYAINQENLGGRTWRDAEAYGTVGAFLADGSGGVVRFDNADNEYTILLDGVADEVNGVCVGGDDGFFAVGAGDALLLYDFDTVPGDELDALDGVALHEMRWADGYLYGLDEEGGLQVLTGRPWVEASASTSAEVTVGDTLGLSVTSDEAGALSIYAGGTAARDGQLLWEGELDGAAELDLTVDDAFEEGENLIWAFVEAGGRLGHGAVVVDVQSPPSRVSLNAGDVGWGDRLVRLAFDPVSDNDVVTYHVYLSDQPFEGADWPSGGPVFTNEDGVEAPVALAADGALEASFYPLQNGTTYYVAVRAEDDAGLEGEMSEVIAVTPEETMSAAEARGDEGGFGCASTGAGAGAGLALAGLLAAAGRRGRRSGLVALAGLGLAAAPAAHAKDASEPVPHVTVQVRGGPMSLQDEYIRTAQGEWNKIARLEYGWTSRFVEVNMGAGYYREQGWLFTSSGESSDEEDYLTIVPLSLTGTLRLDFAKEQLLVPVGRIGGDYWMWKEKWWVPEGSTEDNTRASGRLGWHWAAGGMILLDVLDRKTASELQATTGIDDTFLVVEYRRTMMQHDANKLDFSDKEVTVGLKCDF